MRSILVHDITAMEQMDGQTYLMTNYQFWSVRLHTKGTSPWRLVEMAATRHQNTTWHRTKIRGRVSFSMTRDRVS